MRPMYVIGAAIGVLALVGTLAWTRLAPAQAPGPNPLIATEEKVITADEVEVRSGPSPSFYPTSKLRRGDKVLLVKADTTNPGWLAIKPPEASQSWVEAKYVKVQPNNKSYGIIDTTPDGVDVRPATSLPGQLEQPAKVSTRLQSGTQVTLLGDAKFDPATKTAWYPIQPPERDVRYIPETAVARPNAVQQTGAQVQSGFVAPPGGTPLLSQADQQLDQARELYKLAANSNDPNISGPAKLKLNTLNQLQSPLGQPGYPYNTAQSPGAVGPKVTLGTTASQTGSTALYQTTAQTSGAPQWTAWGTLKKTTMQKDGQCVFRLEDPRGTPLGYAMAAPGYTLDTYVGQTCCLYGPVAYRSDDVLRGHITIVSQIALQPAH